MSSTAATQETPTPLKKEKPIMKKAITAALLAAGLVVGGAAIPANATHPTVSGIAECNDAGQASIVWTVTGDLGKGYNKIDATIETLEINGETPADLSLLGLPLRGDEITQTWLQSVEPGEYRLSVGVQFANHKKGDLAYTKSATVTVPKCEVPDVLDATATAITSAGDCVSPGVTEFAIVNATWENDTDTTDGTRTALANDGHTFADGSKKLDVTYTKPTPLDYRAPECQPTFEIVQECGQITVTFNNKSKWDRYPDFTFSGDGVNPRDFGSGAVYKTVKVPANTSAVIFTKTFDEDYFDGGPVTVTVQDILGAERDIDTAAQTVTVTTNCLPDPVTAEPVQFSDPCGVDNDGWVVPEDSETVSYAVEDARIGGVGVVTVTATATAGFVIDGENVWAHEFTNNDCPVPVKPETPPTTITTSTTPTGVLPFTGSVDNSAQTAGLGIGALLLGAALVIGGAIHRRKINA